MTATRLFPERLFLRMRVNFEDRYGMNLSSFYASPAMTFPSADNDVLMNLAYYSLRPVEFDFLTLYDPAKSISEKFDERYCDPFIFCVMYIVTIVWLRLDN